jgi:hypothetical protein
MQRIVAFLEDSPGKMAMLLSEEIRASGKVFILDEKGGINEPEPEQS